VRHMEINLTLQPKQKEAFYKSFVTPVSFMGGAKGGGKSYLIRARQVYRRMAHANTRGLIVRKTYPELIANHIRPFFSEYPFVRDWYNKAEKTIYWPNGSTTEFSYLKSTDDVYTYQGREYDDADIDEITQHEEEVFKILRSSNRTTHVCNAKCAVKDKNYIPTMLLTGNPGGIGHQWVKRIFIDRQFSGKERASDFDFTPAFVQDNKALMTADPMYVKRLEDLPEHLRRAYLFGDWNIHAGLAFTELAEHVHVVEPFEIIDPQVKWFGGFDWGYQHPFGFVLCAIDGKHNIFVTNYLRQQFKRPDEQGKLVKDIIGEKRINIYTGHDVWAKRGGPEIAKQLRDACPQASWTKAYIDRVQGVAQLRKLFAYQNTERLRPQIYFFKNCMEVFTQVASMQYDEKKPEDVMKQDADEYGNGGDDLYDALRYAVTTWLRPKQAEETKTPKDELLNWIDQRSAARSYLEDF
jgi:phage terminase large subunit